MTVKIVRWAKSEPNEVVEEFLRRPAFDPAAQETARRVLGAIRQGGDAAVSEAIREFNRITLKPGEFDVPKAVCKEAHDRVNADFRTSVREAHKRVAAFARAGIKNNWSMSSPRGGVLGEQYVPLDRVGIYVPGGAAPLISTVIMTVTLAKVAGVLDIVVCTPCDDNGKIDDRLLCALEITGATEVYRLGGIQAIGAMAYGTESIRKVQKIVGPGGPFVTAAKREVYGQVALDSVAGPSEIAVLADETADPRYVAADLLSQAEHGTGHEKALLVTTSMECAQQVQKELERQVATLSRQEAARVVMEKGMLLVVTDLLDDGMDLCNRFAPEHLELLTREPKNWFKKVRSAGAVFAGAWTPEAVGDYVAGPSHVLPTGGTAAIFSGLTVDDFRRRTSFVSYTRADLYDVVPLIEAFGKAEGMDAHVRSAQIRFEK